jgi:RNA polymerase sigma-70 factor (ECF subfamily)
MNQNDVFYDIKIVEMDKTISSASDVILIRRVAGGDEIAFDELYQRYHVPIFNYVLRMMQEPKEAEEILQEIFLAVWKGARQYREQAQVKTWLYRIAHYQAISWLRKHHPVTPLDEMLETSLDGREEVVFDTWQSEDIKKAIDLLSYKHRSVLELAFVQGMSYVEIAQVVGCPVGTVKSRMSYAIKALNGKLKGIDFV